MHNTNEKNSLANSKTPWVKGLMLQTQPHHMKANTENGQLTT